MKNPWLLFTIVLSLGSMAPACPNQKKIEATGCQSECSCATMCDGCNHRYLTEEGAPATCNISACGACLATCKTCIGE